MEASSWLHLGHDQSFYWKSQDFCALHRLRLPWIYDYLWSCSPGWARLVTLGVRSAKVTWLTLVPSHCQASNCSLCHQRGWSFLASYLTEAVGRALLAHASSLSWCKGGLKHWLPHRVGGEQVSALLTWSYPSVLVFWSYQLSVGLFLAVTASLVSHAQCYAPVQSCYKCYYWNWKNSLACPLLWDSLICHPPWKVNQSG